jgi:hypothetical protein
MLGRQPGYKPTKQELSADIALYKQYQSEAIKGMRPAMEPQVRDVPTPDGKGSVRMAQLSNGSWQVLPESKAPEMRMTQAEDGTIILVDPVTGSNFPSYNKDTGAPVKGAKKVDPFAEMLGGSPQSAPVGQSGAATLEPPTPSAPAPAPQPAPSSQAPAPQVYSISGEEDYAKVPPGATVNWNGQTFTKR